MSQKIRRYVAELEGVRDKKLTFTTVKTHQPPRMTTSTTVQFDAAFDRRWFRSASGLVVRDQIGEFEASKMILHSNISSSLVAKARAGLEAIKLVLSMGLNSATIMGD